MIHLTIYTSLIFSIIIQILTGIIETFFLFTKVSSNYLILKQMLLLEVIVQVIESSFYIYWLYNFKNILNITPKRYFDWVLTTPTMLINLVFYLIFLKYLNNNISYELSFFKLFNDEFHTLIIILTLNWLMLLFGYLSEINLIPVLLGVSLGFIPFIIYFYIIYSKYALFTETGFKVYLYFLIIWSMYGVVAILPYKIKNICYNILDLFAKNFFGIFLSYLLYINKN